jgi:hypothetical protein
MLEQNKQAQNFDSWTVDISIVSGGTVLEARNTVTGEATSDVEVVHAIIENTKDRARRGLFDPIEVVLNRQGAKKELE